MRAVGLHFGHDAGVASVTAEGLIGFLSKERRIRTKHALGLSLEDLYPFLERGAKVGLSSTQNIPTFAPPGVRAAVEGGQDWRAVDYFSHAENSHFAELAKWMPDQHQWSGTLVRDGTFYFDDRKTRYASYDALGMVESPHPDQLNRTRRKASLHVGGQSWEAWFYEHHFLHAVYAAHAVSTDQNALVVTNDGAAGPSGGGIFHWTPGKRLTFVSIADAWVGRFYDEVATWLGLGRIGGAGKLMGLAPYGRPIYFEAQLVGTFCQVSNGYQRSVPDIVKGWLGNLPIPEWDRFSPDPPTIVANVASSAQLVVELNIRKLVDAAVQSARRIGFEYDVIVLSGGVALNCPTNSNLALIHEKPILIPPGLNDEGLAIGAAVAAFFDAFEHYPAAPADYAEAVYIGTDIHESDVLTAADSAGWSLVGGLDDACKLLLKGEPLGLCFGRSELGPRALGHRSILVSPASARAWGNTNRLKGREPWRPFAPAVLAEDAGEYFDRGPAESRFMLFTYRCRTDDLPAITHFDHTARVQHVSPETGILYDLLRKMKANGHPPVVLNTSFNGPGIPIVDSMEDAFEEARKLGLRCVLTEFGLYGAKY